MRELGEIDMVSRALATLDLVDHDDARPAFPAVYLEGHTVLSYGELAESADESGRVLRHDSRALVLCAGDRDLATLLESWLGEPPRQPGAWPARCASTSAGQ